MKLMYGENEREAFIALAAGHRLQPRAVDTRSGAARPGRRAGLHQQLHRHRRATTTAKRRAPISNGHSATTCCASASTTRTTPPTTTSYYPGPGALLLRRLRRPTPARPSRTAAWCPPGYNAYVRARRNEIAGKFETDRTPPTTSRTTGRSRRTSCSTPACASKLRQQGRRRQQLHQDGRHDRAAPRLLVGHEGRRHAPSCSATSAATSCRWPTSSTSSRPAASSTSAPTTASTAGTYRDRNGVDVRGADPRAADRRGRRLAGRRHRRRPALAKSTRHGSGLPGRSDPRLPADDQRQVVVGRQRHLPPAAQRHRRHGDHRHRPQCGGETATSAA